jgi:hypothetical protein
VNLEPIKSALQKLGRAASAAASAICRDWYSAVESAYLESHRRLPGSDRTARMRKKRRAKVLEWASQQCGPQDAV